MITIDRPFLEKDFFVSMRSTLRSDDGPATLYTSSCPLLVPIRILSPGAWCESRNQTNAKLETMESSLKARCQQEKNDQNGTRRTAFLSARHAQCMQEQAGCCETRLLFLLEHLILYEPYSNTTCAQQFTHRTCPWTQFGTAAPSSPSHWRT